MEPLQESQIAVESFDKAWLLEYRHGNVDAMGALVEHYRRPLFGFILRMTEGREDAEEIFQEVWFRVKGGTRTRDHRLKEEDSIAGNDSHSTCFASLHRRSSA